MEQSAFQTASHISSCIVKQCVCSQYQPCRVVIIDVNDLLLCAAQIMNPVVLQR